MIQSALRAVVNRKSVGSDAILLSCYNSSIGKTRIKMQTFRIIDENPSHENAASKLVLAAVRFFILAVLIRFKQHSAPPFETTFLPFFSLPLSACRCAMIKFPHADRGSLLFSLRRSSALSSVGPLSYELSFMSRMRDPPLISKQGMTHKTMRTVCKSTLR